MPVQYREDSADDLSRLRARAEVARDFYIDDLKQASKTVPRDDSGARLAAPRNHDEFRAVQHLTDERAVSDALHALRRSQVAR